MSSGLSSNDGRAVPTGVDNAAGSPLAPGQKSVTVSLRVVLDLSANVQLFAYPADQATNPIYCATTMAASDISGLFAFLEMGPSGEGISGELGSNAAAVSGAGSAAAVRPHRLQKYLARLENEEESSRGTTYLRPLRAAACRAVRDARAGSRSAAAAVRAPPWAGKGMSALHNLAR